MEEETMDIIAKFEQEGLVVPSADQVLNRQWIAIAEAQQLLKRIDAYCILADCITNQEVADLFTYVWIHSEGSLTHEQLDFLFRKFDERGIDRTMIMSSDERQTFDALPDPFTIFRGCQESTRSERSWTLCPELARPFALRAAGENTDTHTGIVICASCPKSAVLAYLNRDLAEKEVLVRPEQIAIQTAPVETVTDDE